MVERELYVLRKTPFFTIHWQQEGDVEGAGIAVNRLFDEIGVPENFRMNFRSWVDVVPQEINKGVSLKWIVHQVATEDNVLVIMIGDALNDVPGVATLLADLANASESASR